MRKTWAALPLVPALVVLALIAPAGASGAAGSQASARQGGDLTVDMTVHRFAQRRGKTIAKGIATAKLMQYNGQSTTIKAPITLAVKSAGSCKILSLVLDKLQLQLLGLNVNLDKVNLQVTGRRSGGVLGSLFCKLARAKVSSARASAIKRLNAHVGRRGLRPLAFTLPVAPKARESQAAPSCKVLDLVVGPLNLQLLGLVVDLNQVHLNVTATPGGGTLGDLFCSLSK
jgi:hypothetical protein